MLEQTRIRERERERVREREKETSFYNFLLSVRRKKTSDPRR